MALNQKLYITNPQNGGTRVTSIPANTLTTVLSNTDTEPYKVTGLKFILLTSAGSITPTLRIGNTVDIRLPSITSGGDIIDILSTTSIVPTALDQNGQQYFILPAGASINIQIPTSSTGTVIVTFESYKA